MIRGRWHNAIRPHRSWLRPFLPGEVQAQLIALKLSASLSQSPLPDPEILARYNELIPNAADRIMQMVEAQEQHRRSLEEFSVKAESMRSLWGLGAGFVVAIGGLAAATVMSIAGHAITGAIIGGLDIASIVGVFVYGTQSRKAEREEKARLMVQPQPGTQSADRGT